MNSCTDPDLIKQKGYIVFNYAEFFQFVPTKSLDLSTSISSFRSENLEKGIEFFSYESLGNYYDTIFSHIDTFRIEDCDKSLSLQLSTLKIVPVLIEYKLDAATISKTIYKLSYKVKGRSVKYSVDFCRPKIMDIKILRVKNMNKKGSYFEDISICPPPPE